MSSSKKSWFSEHSGALIGAFAVIVAALITSGYFKSGSSDNSPKASDKNTEVVNQNLVSKKPEEVPSVEPAKPFNLEKYKDLYQFAYGGSGMNMNSSDATAFTDSWFSLCSDKDISKFKEVYIFAYSGGGMNKSGNDAKNWALKSVGCEI
ncbi:hypothetical protein VroAM7_16140 [Vibrio rotiferianus]|uniref:Uncharacterized protein n=1 Tax=Vibrio rotiferianus TaxID=190895 RepID=A0A510I678_9VIBR|nr:hypothetical protein [Vibrio rotiferianus]BBL88961.1 hypothetical protein VroAM7_16140 [Vibrio rotiferianus]